jgi:surface protein pspA
MKKYIYSTLLLILGISATLTLSSQAGQWINEGDNWTYIKDNNTYPESEWMKDKDGSWYYFNQDGYMAKGWIISNGKWYYLDPVGGYLRTNMWVGDYYVGKDGAMLTDTSTPDGYRVDSYGMWMNAERMSHNLNNEAKEYIKLMLTQILDYNSSEKNLPFPAVGSGIRRDRLNSEEKAFLTYAYIYNIENNSKNARGRYSNVHLSVYVLSKSDFMEVMKEAVGSSNESDIRAYEKRYSEFIAEDTINTFTSASFGAVPDYMPSENMNISSEGDRIKVSGDILSRYEDLSVVGQYKAYFSLSRYSNSGFLLFEELDVQ